MNIESCDELVAMIEEHQAIVFARCDVTEQRVEDALREMRRALDILASASGLLSDAVRQRN